MSAVRRIPALWLAVLVLFGLIALSETPWLKPVPGLDGGVYGYMGQRLLAGDWPYRDVFDHKPPLIYAVNAVGWWLGGRWGVWLLLTAWTGAALALAGETLRRAFGAPVAAVALLLALGSFVLIGDFNRPETLALLPQFAAFWLVQRGRERWQSAALLGVLAALALLLKHNLTALWPAIGLLWLLETLHDQRWFGLAQRVLAATLAGTALVAGVLALFWRAGALPALWDALVTFNLAYVGQVGWLARGRTVIEGLELLAAGGLVLLALAGWLGGVRRWRAVGDAAGPPRSVKLALLTLPLELLAAGLSGQGFAHYFIAWLPVLVILGAYVVAETRALWQQARGWALALLLAACLLPATHLLNRLAALGGGGDAVKGEAATVQAAADYLRAHTTADQPVLVWGGASNVYLLAGRRAATRWHYQYPLYLPGYQSEALVAEFVRQLAADPPALIVVNWPPGSDDGDFIAGQARFWATFDAFDWYPLPGMRAAYLFVDENYRFVTEIGPNRWAVYEYLPATADDQ